MESPDEIAASQRRLVDAQNRAARDAAILDRADTVISDSRQARADNGWADMIRGLFRG